MGITDGQATSFLAAAFWSPLSEDWTANQEPPGSSDQIHETIVDHSGFQPDSQVEPYSAETAEEGCALSGHVKEAVELLVRTSLEVTVGYNDEKLPYNTSFADLGLDSLDLLKLAT